MATAFAESDRREEVLVPTLGVRGGTLGILAPFALFLAGVSWLGLSGAPDERGFWPVLVAALALAVALGRDRTATIEVILRGMSQPLVMLMVMAWLLAGILGAILGASGLITALVAVARGAHFTGGAFAAAAFLVGVLMSTATGTSLGTILIAGPVLYPAGGALGASPVWLAGAILAGATFGDSISPVSDTTIASSATQDADIGGTVRSRLKYALPAGLVALAMFALLGGRGASERSAAAAAAFVTAMPLGSTASLRALVMLLVPVLVVAMLLRQRHMLEGLLAGIAAAALLAVVAGLLTPSQLLHIDAARFGARGLIVEGMERGVGASVFTILLMGLTATLDASGMLARVVAFAQSRVTRAAAAEWWIVGATTAAVMLTTHSVVAILTVGAFAKDTGARYGIGAYRRANLLDVTACTWPFLLPFFIPTILAASVTASGEPFGMPRVSALGVGLANVYSWGLLVMLALAVTWGYGRSRG